MTNKRQIKAFEATLDGFRGAVYGHANAEDDLLFRSGFPMVRKEMESVRPGLEILGLYERIREALQKAEQLVKEGKCEEGYDTLTDAFQALMKASGTWEDMKRRYTTANEPKAKA